MLDELTAWLTECTGYDAMSLQPNSELEVRRINGDQALPPGSWRSTSAYMSYQRQRMERTRERGDGRYDGCVSGL